MAGKIAMLYYFLFISVIALFSSLLGIFVNVMFNDYGIVLAILFYGMCYFTDYFSTVRLRNFARYESNPLYNILTTKLGTRLPFLVTFAVGMISCIVSWYVLQDTILIYVLGISHLCIALTNSHTAKKIQECTQ